MLGLERCWLTTDLGNGIRNAMRDWAREEHLQAYDQSTAEGYLRHLVVREGRNTGQALVQLVTHVRERFDRERLIEVLTAFPEVRSIHWSVNDTPAEVTNLPSELLWGEEAIEEELGGLRFRVRPNAFLQTNTRMAERLYELAREEAALTGTETVYDLYCGIGTIGLSLAQHALTVWGIEISEESVACAIENAELNSIGNAAFFAGNVGQVLRDLRERAGDPDVVVVDPPRAGLAGKALKRLGELAAPRVVYVSCNPTTLAGDTKRLVEEYGLHARTDAPARHVPAHAARRVGLAADALELAGLGATEPRPGEPPPEQVAVRDQEPDRDRRQRRQAAVRPERRRRHRDPEPDQHRDPRRERPQPESRARSQEHREEEDVRQAEPRSVSAGNDEPDRELREHRRMMFGDRLRGAAPDRVGVHPRDHERDGHDPRERLEGMKEEEAGGGDRRRTWRSSRTRVLRPARRRARATTKQPSATASSIRRSRNGSASQVKPNIAGIRTTATKTTLHQVESAPRCGAVSNHASRAAKRTSTAAARPTRGRLA